MEIHLKRIAGYKFEAANSAGKTAVLDGPHSIGGGEDGLRPMEMVLIGLAGCSSFDILQYLEKARQTVKNFEVTVKAKRAETIPAVFTEINIYFEASGIIEIDKFKRAAQLSMEKYCSVARMLEKTARIQYFCSILESVS